MSSRKILLLAPLLILCSQIVYAASIYTCPQPSELVTTNNTWQCPDGFECRWIAKSPTNIIVGFTAAGLNTQGAQCNYGNSEGNVAIIGKPSSNPQPVDTDNWNKAGGTWVSKPNTTIMDLAWEYKP